MKLWPDAWRRKQSTTTGATIARFAGRPVYHTVALADYATYGYQGNPDIKVAVDKKAGAAAGIRLRVERLQGDEWEETGDLHPLQALLDRPNPQQGNSAFVFDLFANRAIYGNTYIERVGPKNRPPMELYSLSPQCMKVVAGDSVNPVGSFLFEINGQKQSIDREHVLHWKTYHPTDPFYGMPPLEAAAKLVDQALAASDWNLSQLQNMAVPSGFLRKLEGDTTPSELKMLRESIDQKWSGPANAGRPGLLPGGYEWQSAGQSLADMQFMELHTMLARKFAMVIGVPPELVDGKEKKFANYSEARRSLYEEAVLPELDLLLDDLNPWLCPLFESQNEKLRIVFDKDDIEALQEQRDALYKRASDAWFLTINQKLALVGETQLTGDAGDVVLVPSSFLPLDVVTGVSTPREPKTDASSGDGQNVVDDGEPALVGKAKAFNLTTEERKAAYWKLVDAKRSRAESTAYNITHQRLTDETDAVVTAITNASGPLEATVAAHAAVDAGAQQWAADLTKLYLAVGKPFAEAVLDDLKADAPSRVKVGVSWQSLLSAYVKRVVASKVTQVTQTTKDQIARNLDAGIAEGESIPVLANRVKDALTTASPSRARTIARTETVSASNAASKAAAESTGLPLEKEWISTRDNRTRSSHEDMDGETVGMDESFTVNGDSMDFPGDSSQGADAGEVVNCRCTQGYTVAS